MVKRAAAPANDEGATPKKGRKSGGGSSAASGSGGDEAARATAAMNKGSTIYPWMSEFCDAMDTLLDSHGTPSNLLRFLLSGDDAKLSYAKTINDAYPPHALSLLSDWAALGRTCIPVWAASFEEMAGNAGHVLLDRFKRLMILILINGVETNPDIHYGVDLPLVKKLDPKLVDVVPVQVDGYYAGIGSIVFVKGWRRFMAANLVQLLLIRINKVDDYVKRSSTDILQSWSNIIVKMVDWNEDKSMDTSRGRDWIYNDGQTVF